MVVTCVILAALFVSNTGTLFAATFSFSPSEGTFNVGQTLSVAVQTNSGGEAINAFSGVVSFNTNLLQVESVSKSNSIISLWVVEPVFSNTSGTVSFEGIVLNPGYSGTAGRLVTITFRVKKAGTVPLTFASGTILANDGSGTDVLSKLGVAKFTLVSKQVVPFESRVPVVVSSGVGVQNPSETQATELLRSDVLVTRGEGVVEGWLNSKTALFNFGLTPEVTALRLLLDTIPDSVPVIVYEPPIASKEIEDLPEGTSYLHIQTKTADGWGAVVHHKIEIDTVIPDELLVERLTRKGEGSMNDGGVFSFTATDTHSGIVRFEVILDSAPVEVFLSEGYSTYISPKLPAGEHTLLVRAFDSSGNSIEKTLQFSVDDQKLHSDTSSMLEKEISRAGMIAIGVPPVRLLLTFISLGALLILLTGIVMYLLRCRREYSRHVHAEVLEAQAVTKQVFTRIKTDLEADILLLENAKKKSTRTSEKAKLNTHIKQNIAGAEKAILKELEDISK